MTKIKPKIQVEKRDGHLLPISIYDAEEIQGCFEGQLFDLIPVYRRSDPHHKLYWAILGRVVKQTGSWASSTHLHDDLKMLCGFYRSVINQASGDVYYVPDSIAYRKMDQRAFSDYFEAAMLKLAETIGFDPMEVLNDTSYKN